MLKEWKKGSPFLNALKGGGYKIFLNGSPWQYCIDTNRFFNKKVELLGSAESNLQLLYGLKTKDLVDFCYANPGGTSLPQREPQVKFTGLDENNKMIGHQGYRDHEVVSDLLKMIDQRGPNPSGNFHLVYLSGVHDPYSWLEYGYPVEESDHLEPIENYYKINKPFFPWNPNWHAYRPKNPTEEFKTQIRNSYINAVRAVDFEIGRVIKKLKDLERYDNSLIVVVSDHGELLNENYLFQKDSNDRIGHCCAVTNETTNVPLLIKFPDNEFVVERKVGSHLDIFPTLFDYIGYNNQQSISNIAVGKSLFASNRVCAISFDPRGSVAPENFVIADIGSSKFHYRLRWKYGLSQRDVLPRFVSDAMDRPTTIFGEGFTSPVVGYKQLRLGIHAPCVEELTSLPFGDSKYCPMIAPLKIADLTRGFEFHNQRDRLASKFIAVDADAEIAKNEKSGANILEDFDEVPLIKTELEYLVKTDFRFDNAFFQEELKKAPNYEFISRKKYVDKFERLKRVNGYVFHGSGIPPGVLNTNNGTCSLNGNFDLNQHFHEGKPSQFISTSRSPLVAKRFASVNFHDKSPRNGWVYVILAFGGIMDLEASEKLKYKDIKNMNTQDKNKNIDENYDLPIIMSLYAEQEIVMPKGFNWADIVAFRAVTNKGLFEGPIQVRESLKDVDNEAYKKIINKLSGE